MKQTENKFVSTRELGELLGVTRQTVRNWIKKGDIKAFHIGQNLKIPAQEAVRILMFYGVPVPSWLTQEKRFMSSHEAHDGLVTEDHSWASNQADKESPDKQAGLFESRQVHTPWRSDVGNDSRT